MSPTIKDVARRAGVAVSTVSLVVNRKGKVSAETRERVLRAVAELNYHPHRSARGLVTQRSGNLGFILTDDHFSRAEPFYTKVFLGTEFEARGHDYYILLTTVEQRFRREGVPRFLLERDVDGVIFAGKVPSRLVEYVKQQGLPIVLVDYYPPRGDYSCVLIDNVGGAQLAVSHLVHKGHRRIAFVGGDLEHPSIHERFLGYREALTQAGIEVLDALVVTDQPYTGTTDGYEAAKELLDRGQPFTALFAANDAMAVGALRLMQEGGIKVPNDVAIVGFDDVEAAITTQPTLTTVRVPKEELGAIAVRRLVEQINHNDRAISRTIVPTTLVLRESA
ncbi:MAG: LacI family DNA-binding transcriptional regulator [bacterium]|jgi:LacI family transcriptional regulator|nr:LacI family transcriptional regulator [candidate division KSB1 bacterium]MDH7559534.1 LacI family DNA-binding transcriptional regulator [bacterium]